MLTDNPPTEVPGPAVAAGGPGERIRRLRRRRRLVREEVLAVLVLLLFLAVTVAVLATQWLASGPAVGSSAASHPVMSTTPHGGTT